MQITSTKSGATYYIFYPQKFNRPFALYYDKQIQITYNAKTIDQQNTNKRDTHQVVSYRLLKKYYIHGNATIVEL